MSYADDTVILSENFKNKICDQTHQHPKNKIIIVNKIIDECYSWLWNGDPQKNYIPHWTLADETIPKTFQNSLEWMKVLKVDIVLSHSVTY